MSGEPKPPSRIVVDWAGAHRFDTGRPNGPVARIDSDGITGQSPVDALLSALAACTSTDVVDIMTKRHTPLARLHVEVTGHRVTTTPRRFDRILLEYHLDGEGIGREHAERAIDLSITKYCSVRESMLPSILFEWTLVLNGEPGVLINTAGAAR